MAKRNCCFSQFSCKSQYLQAASLWTNIYIYKYVYIHVYIYMYIKNIYIYKYKTYLLQLNKHTLSKNTGKEGRRHVCLIQSRHGWIGQCCVYKHKDNGVASEKRCRTQQQVADASCQVPCKDCHICCCLSFPAHSKPC